MKGTPTIWVLIDERLGTGNQSRGVALSLGAPFVEKHLVWSIFANLPNLLIGASLRGLKNSSKSTIKPPWPGLVIASGRRAAQVARFIKYKNPKKCSLIQIMYPGSTAIKDFEIVAIPNHDNRFDEKDNFLNIVGAPHSINDNQLNSAKTQWDSKFSVLKKPVVGLVIGGATKRKPFTLEMASKLASQSANVVNKLGGSLVITSSPRTGNRLQNILDVLLEKNVKPAFVHSWAPEDLADDNPYLGILAHADYLIVTGDSTSMCSEACATGNPVYIFAPNNFLHPKHRRFIEELISGGHAYLLRDEFIISLAPALQKKLDTASKIAEEIKSRNLLGVDRT